MCYTIEKTNTKIIPLEVPAPNMLKSINFYLLQKNDGTFLIDAGLDKDTYWEYLLQSMQANGIRLRDLTAILLTHHHFDQVGLVHRISKKYEIPVYIHPYALPKIKGDPEFLYKSYSFFADLLNKLNTGDFGKEQVRAKYKRQMNNPKTALNWNVKAIESNTLFGFEVIEIPGHAPDQVAFSLPEENIIFIGDLLIDHLRSNAFVEPALDGSRIPALAQHVASLEKIIELNPEIALSGHGKVIYEPAKLAKRRLEAIKTKAKSIKAVIEAGFTTGSEIVKKRHPNKYEDIFLTLMSDTLSFLDYLEAKDELTKKEKNGIWYWDKGSEHLSHKERSP
ncbi:MBL fold metallo-hydrolase [Oceanobacillus alkalisoli]|uniref:MBL fold metallo-hydrolase n=1 Tax=Oceanobacillus alkalisoli TaxID=2925113 RepID=UPI001F121C52|nr:MBL fold metallo-hydrolase [Oceanobacillus alkalisoli]MCF3943095.1 MBL fold metallo-hydrolase [Oceanobacillus alkalisoli]